VINNRRKNNGKPGLWRDNWTEVHAELSTKTKIFCSCPTEFGADPNTHVCPVCMAMPVALPVLNEKVVEYAVKAWLATNCSISQDSKNDRKNYFYPDLPKSYQISQFDKPLCNNGYIEIEDDNGNPKKVRILRIHIEEDAGKLNHNEFTGGSLVDLNRAGVPLIEIVSEPDLRSSGEADRYLKKLKSILQYIEVSDCKMQEGSLRADVNVSVHKKDEPFGTRCEMKNMNSFKSIQRAIEYEKERQINELEHGRTIIQETNWCRNNKFKHRQKSIRWIIWKSKKSKRHNKRKRLDSDIRWKCYKRCSITSFISKSTINSRF